MADPLESLKYLIEGLRSPKTAPGGTIHNYNGSGEDAVVPDSGPHRFPIEQRRDGYRMYAQEKANAGETPLSYQEWISQEQ